MKNSSPTKRDRVRWEREREVLSALASARDIAPSMKGWLTPMFCGGRDASYHSHVLLSLVKRGLVEKEMRGGWTKRSWQYRITPAGRSWLKRLQSMAFMSRHNVLLP